ncbi:MAG: hypothetical protein FJX92_01080 [Bacteroidetes bacterium]|nr:hypothetical protein [Bacteroidota bacterium]
MKSSFSSRLSAYLPQVAEALLWSMVIGLFVSRALLSLSVGLFFLLAFFRLGLRGWWIEASRDRLGWILGTLWLLPLFSGWWSEDRSAWTDVIRIKLPLLLLPLGWVGLSLTKNAWGRLGWLLVGCTFLGAVYSIFPFIQDAVLVQENYLRGKSLPTPLGDDRVRFSWLIVAVVWWLQQQWEESDRPKRWWILAGGLLFVLYLHVLAVRIGLICFYLLAAFILLRQLLRSSSRYRSLIGMTLLLLLPLLMYQTLPTFRARVDYIRYDWSYTFQGKYLPGGNDAIRMQSLEAAAACIRNGPFYGVGFGDIRSVMDSAYAMRQPDLPKEERIYPTNEWAVYGVGMGWVGLISFSLLMIGLFFLRSTDPFRWRCWVLATILSFVTDIGLEVQYGVFLVPFLFLFFRSVDRLKNQEIRI